MQNVRFLAVHVGPLLPILIPALVAVAAWAPFGTWRSPLSAQVVTADALRLGSVAIDGRDIYWLEGRPDEGGRNVLVRSGVNGRTVDVTPPGTNVRTRANEYGGAAYLVAKAIKHAKVLGFADLGMEAIYEFDVTDMPVTVAVDSNGVSVHDTGPKEWQQRIAAGAATIKINPA